MEGLPSCHTHRPRQSGGGRWLGLSMGDEQQGEIGCLTDWLKLKLDLDVQLEGRMWNQGRSPSLRSWAGLKSHRLRQGQEPGHEKMARPTDERLAGDLETGGA